MKRSNILVKSGILCLSILLIGTQYTYAQKTLTFSAKGGFNIATLFGDTYSNLGFKPGIVLGGQVEMSHNDNWSFQGELYFSQEGAQNANYDFSTFSTVIYNQTLNYTYLNLPILAKRHLANGLNLHGGLQFGFRLSANENRVIKSGTPSPTDNSEGKRNLNGRIKFLYPSLTVGAGYQLTDKLNAQARLYSSIFDNVKRRAGDSEGTYPMILQLTVSYKLFQKEVGK